MKKAVIFVRGNNTAGQYLVCNEYCEAKGYEVVGRTDSMREAFLHIDDYEVLVVVDETRLSRKEKNTETIKEAFEEIGITIETAREFYDNMESEKLSKHIHEKMSK